MFSRILLTAAFALALDAQDARLVANQKFTAAVRTAAPVGAPIKFGEARVLVSGLSTEIDPGTFAEMNLRLQMNEAEKDWVRDAYQAAAASQRGLLLSQIAAAERSNDLTKLARIFGQ